MLAYTYPLLDIFWTMLWFFCFFIYIWLLIIVFTDIFRSHDMGGWAKFFWVLFIIILPYLGVFVYLIARGNKMAQHAQADAARGDVAARAYIRDAVSTSPADELARLADLRDKGVIDENEFNQLKSQVLSS